MLRFAVFALAVATSTTLAEECTLECPSDAPCVIGQADFSHHSSIELDRGTGTHCACPPGWTGLFCDHKYESCTDDHSCYHGGECIAGLNDRYGNGQLFCDCSKATASDGTNYVGKYCETPFDKLCDESGDRFCVNGGDCNPSFALDGQACICPDGWEGYHCEFKIGSVPECDFNCKNDGVCVVGVASPEEAAQMHHLWSREDIDSHMRCICPPDFGGQFCESTSEECGEDQCYHGGSCVTTTVSSNGVTETEFRCDCTTASDGDNRFAGRFCEYSSNVFCSDDDDNLFCTNGGSCADDPTTGCKCPNGFAGFKCDVPTHENPTHHKPPHSDNDDAETDAEQCGDVYCFNGGKCLEKQLTLEDGAQGTELVCDCSGAFDDKDLFAGPSCQYKSTQFCSQPTENGSLEGVEFCVNGGKCLADNTCKCHDGWAGDRCGFHSLLEKTPQDPKCGDHVCFNGGGCVETQVIQDDGSTESEFHCDCASAFDETHLFAGDSCQHPSTHLCTHPKDGVETLEGQIFCVNHGHCRDNPRSGCNCPDGFTGFSCEYEVVDEDPDEDEDDEALTEACGDLICHNGGSCVTSLITTTHGNQREIQHCDCSTTVTDESIYAGDQCQFEASTFCTRPKSGTGLETSLYCVNDGECRNNVLQGCDCPIGWTGFRCEFPADTDDLLDDDDEEDGMVQECGDMFCYNGGQCETGQKVDNNGDLRDAYTCDCAAALSDVHLFAGPTCQHKSTSVCREAQGGIGLAGSLFCVNHGDCRQNPLEGCDCPSGWTGTMCELEVEDDEHADEGEECGDGYCYNDGSCVTTKIISKDGSEQTEFHCDCSTAFDDTDLYGGESCEHKSTAFCTRPRRGETLQGILFCVNGGTCNDNPQQGCDCLPEWTGFGCEFAVDPDDVEDEDAESSVQECGDAVCLNGGDCVSTTIIDNDGHKEELFHCDCIMAFTDVDRYAGPQCEHKSTTFCTQPAPDAEDLFGVQFCVNGGRCNRDNVLQGCVCHPAWTGLRCEFEAEIEDSSDEPALVDDYVECGDDQYCYNGGSCRQYRVDGETKYSCDCTTAITDTHLFDGRFCQYKSTALCSEFEGNDLEGVEFCVNGGRCNEDRNTCHCPSGYTGTRCEFTLYENQDSEDNIAPDESGDDDDDDDSFEYNTCHLQCKNDGHCAKGAKDLGNLYDTVEHVGHLNKTYSEEFFEHCICSEYFVGLECEYKLEVCGENEHYCLHGSKCIKNNEQHGCDCSTADEIIGHGDQPTFAGDSCQHPATDICMEGEDYPGRPLYFCVNQGRCKLYVAEDEPNPGCDCLESWTGPHCELRIEADAAQSKDTFKSIEKRGAEVFLLFFIALVIVVGVLVFSSYCIRRRQSTNDVDGSQTCMSFRRRRRNRYVEDENLAPKRLSVMDPPSVFPSNSDPVTTGLSLPPDDEPEPYRDEPEEPYRDEPEEPYEDDPVVVNIGPQRDEDGHELHNVDFI